MPSNDQEPDLRAAQLELLGGILKPLDHAGDKSDPGRRWENSDNGITFHSSSGLDITIVESAFCEAGIEISRAQNGADAFLVIPDESATRITPGAMTTLEQHVGAHVLAGILNDGFTPNSDVSAQWEADAGKGGIRKPNTRVYTDTALEAIDLSREMRERMNMETSIKHRPADDGETTRYMVVISMAPDPHGQISDISNGLQAQNQVTDQAQSRGHIPQARRSAMGRQDKKARHHKAVTGIGQSMLAAYNSFAIIPPLVKKRRDFCGHVIPQKYTGCYRHHPQRLLHDH